MLVCFCVHMCDTHTHTPGTSDIIRLLPVSTTELASKERPPKRDSSQQTCLQGGWEGVYVCMCVVNGLIKAMIEEVNQRVGMV